MSCKDEYELIMFADGVELPRPRHDYGCKNETRRYSVTTTIPGPVSYRWTMDNNQTVLSTLPYFDFTFDTITHNIVCSADGPSCGISISAKAYGSACVDCPTICSTQTATIPAGAIVSLTDEVGKIYPLTPAGTTICKDNSNSTVAMMVKRAVRAKTKCAPKDLRVAIYNNNNGRSCISLTIMNSPIRFSTVTVGSTKYPFNTTNC